MFPCSNKKRANMNYNSRITPPKRAMGGVVIDKTTKGGHFRPASLWTVFHAAKRRFVKAGTFETMLLSLLRYAKNRETAQYTSSSAIKVFITFACFENNHLKTEPKADQHKVNAKPINAKSRAKPASGKN